MAPRRRLALRTVGRVDADLRGGGKFRYEEDLLNMVHVLEDMRESGALAKVNAAAMPPKHPIRDFSRPDA